MNTSTFSCHFPQAETKLLSFPRCPAYLILIAIKKDLPFLCVSSACHSGLNRKKKAEYFWWELNYHSETNSFCETFHVLRTFLRLGKQFSYCWLHYLRTNAGNSFCKTIVGGNKAAKWRVFVNWRDLNLAFLLTSRAGGGKVLNEAAWFASSVKSLAHQTFWWCGKDWQEPQESSGNAQSDFGEPCGNAAQGPRAGYEGNSTKLQLLPQNCSLGMAGITWDKQQHSCSYTSLRNSLSFCVLPPFHLIIT